LANPDENIEMNKFCASTFPDYEVCAPLIVFESATKLINTQGELVFVTSKACKDISISDAPSYILGYTCGNDLSCRLHQLPDQAGGQFFFAKACDKFAPLGPVLVSPEVFGDLNEGGKKIIVKVNGEVRQEQEFKGDLIWNPSQILSRMSQGAF
jgi:2-keto-4-pentenoate hydratase/2-oxohepta-3-ene-1,7-dioic acid hydratase in catechol pathway